MMFASQLSGFINLIMEGIHRDSVLVGNGSFIVRSLDFLTPRGKKMLCVRTVLFFPDFTLKTKSQPIILTIL